MGPPMELNEQQRTASEYGGGHVLVLAGAGTGKTRTIIARAAHLIQRVDSKRILLLTFTRRAAKEMTHRLKLMVGPAAEGVMAGTFHHFCLAMMRQMPRRFRIGNATVIDRDDQVQLMKLARVGFVSDDEKFPPASQLINIHSYARNTNRPIRAYLEKHTELDPETAEKVCDVFASYEKRKRANSYLDYDDILYLFVERLYEDTSLRDRLRRLYDHILVDEMQDTNPLQWLILDGLRDPAKLFCVGDDAQSIYAFRGADFQNIHSFTQRVPNSVVLKLESNYRSTQEILDLANWLLAESPLSYGKKLRAFRRAGIKPRLLDFYTDFDEAGWIVGDLLQRHETGAPWNAHMILTRTASAARPVEAALVAKDIPYRFIGGTSLLQAAHVKDLLCMVRVAASHHDELAWVRYLTLWPRIGDRTAARVITAIHECKSVDEALEQLCVFFRSRPTIGEGPLLIRKHWQKPAEALQQGAHFLEPLLKDRYERWDIRRTDFDLLVHLARQHKSLTAFIETYALDPVSSTTAARLEEDDVVTVITAHSAKGTEARVCYVIRAEPGMYPHVRSFGDMDQEEEDRRVLYVAMTRAKDELILTRTGSLHGRTIFHGGFTAAHSPSEMAYLLETVPGELIERDALGFESFWTLTDKAKGPLRP